jgi:pimeloyl-ACP methyl ester carboxylesterase
MRKRSDPVDGQAHRRRAGGRALACAAIVAIVVACSPAADSRPTPATTSASASPNGPTAAGTAATAPGLGWRATGDGFETAPLAVPLDEATPGSKQITIMLARRPAADPANRIGSLLLLPGGPGSSGIDWVKLGYADLPALVRQRFDVVSFDPRGMGLSTPLLDCSVATGIDTADLVAGAALSDAMSAIQREQAACETANPDLLPHVGTTDVVGDVERIRQALGEEQITLYGQSYGTLTGELYAERYPGHVRALLLDAPLDPAVDPEQGAIDAAVATQDMFDRFIASCDADHSCALHGAGGARRAYHELMARLGQGPIDGVTLEQVGFVVEMGLAIDGGADIAKMLDEVRRGDASSIRALTAGGGDPRADGYGLAVYCLDWPFRRPVTEDAILDHTKRLRAVAPDFADADGTLVCGLWPLPANRETAPLRVAATVPILIISSTGDLFAPYKHAVSLAKELASSVLVTRDGFGHTSVGQGNSCVDDIAEAYLVRLQLPPVSTTCR